MAEPSAFRGVIDFFVDIGLYDVVLPFLLVFTVVFAIFEKSRVFGSEKIGDKEYPKKNLDAMAAFVIAFFVVASAKLVEVITKVSSQFVVLLLGVVLFLVLVGSFRKESDEGIFLDGNWDKGFTIAMLLGMIFIFLNALNLLDTAYNWLKNQWSNEIMASIALMATLVIAMIFIVSPNKKSSNKKEE